MQNILIWIDSSTKIKSKLIKLKDSLRVNFDNILFVTKDEKIAQLYRSELINTISIEENINKFFKKKDLKLITMNQLKINSILLSHIFLLAFYKKSYFENRFSVGIFDKYTEFSIFESIWLDLIEKNKITHILNLNGLSIPAFTLTFVSNVKSLKLLFWENGLLPNTLFINKSGVNAFANPAIEIKQNLNIRYFDYNNINILLNNIFNNIDKSFCKILVTLQVDEDSNIKLFSPFLRLEEFVYFVINEIGKNSDDFLFKLRKHPKNNSMNLKKYLKYKNVTISKNSLIDDFDWCDLVITLNSTTGIESIICDKPLLCFGNSFYSKFLNKYKYKYKDDYLDFFFYDPNKKSDKLIKQNLLNCLKKFSLDIRKKDIDWNTKILANYQNNSEVFYKDKDLIKYIQIKKYLKIKNKANNFFKKIILFLIKKIIDILNSFYGFIIDK